jgi:peptidoglycan/xylan/chitin deacetylase (PgdA/CDA1 family)
MLRVRLTAILVVLLSVILGVPRSEAEDEDDGRVPGIPVLLYHRVGDARYPSTNVPLDAFRQQMEYLRAEGFQVISTADLAAHLRDDAELPARPVVIQFDDGYRSVYENAVPVLREFGYPFTVFVPTDALDRGFGDYMTWEMAAELPARGGSVASHGRSHSRLVAAGLGKGDAPDLDGELRGSRKALEARSLDPSWIAYPYGEYSPAVLAATEAAGYQLGFAQDPGTASRWSDPFRIPRYAVVGGLGEFGTFRERLTYRPLPARPESPAPGVLDPTFDGRIKVCFDHADEYGLASANLFLSEKGRLEAGFDVATGCLTSEIKPPLTRRLNRVLVSVREKGSGRYGLTSWVVVNPDGRF